jgi:hypothetical protein
MADPRLGDPAGQRKAELERAAALVTRGYITPRQPSMPPAPTARNFVARPTPEDHPKSAGAPKGSTPVPTSAIVTQANGYSEQKGGHTFAPPVIGSPGTARLSQLDALHRSMVAPKASDVLQPPTTAERDLALARARDAACPQCSAFVNGLARGAVGGAAIARMRMARKPRGSSK